MAQRILHLVRHGQYAQAAPAGEEPDGSLTDAGKRQARLTARRLSELPIAVIHHSTLRRAAETAKILATHLPDAELRPSDLLRECIPCVPEEFAALFADISASLLARGGAQAEGAFAQYLAPLPEGGGDDTNRHEVLVSSGNLINYLVCRAIGAPPDAWMHADIQHCGISEIVIGPPRGLLLARHNDAGHLPRELHTFA